MNGNSYDLMNKRDIKVLYKSAGIHEQFNKINKLYLEIIETEEGVETGLTGSNFKYVDYRNIDIPMKFNKKHRYTNGYRW